MLKFSFVWQGEIGWRHVAAGAAIALAIAHALGGRVPGLP